ncbi:MAG TPA: glycoside hydrolase, partial [Granulicella sp.]
MRLKFICLLSFLILSARFTVAQGTVPTFTHAVGGKTYTLAGQSPEQASTTTIPTVLVPVALDFESKKVAGKAFRMDAKTDVPQALGSPVFSRAVFGSAGTTQYADAMLRSTFPKATGWHTLLAKPEVKPVTVSIPAGFGYVLTSKSSGTSVAVVDIEFLQKEIFKQLPKQDGKLVIALTHNVTYYADGDATVCCSWGTHGVDAATGNSFVLASYLRNAPAIVADKDVQPLTQQL